MFEYLHLYIQDISGLSTYDNITISASFVYMTEDHFDCEKKLKMATDRMGAKNAKDHMEKINGCGSYRSRHRYEIDGIRYHECLCGYRNPYISFYLDIEDKFRQGILPFEGSYMDQPAKVVEIMNRISHLKFDKMERERVKLEKEYKNNSR